LLVAACFDDFHGEGLVVGEEGVAEVGVGHVVGVYVNWGYGRRWAGNGV
jgi:hypothetical protein